MLPLLNFGLLSTLCCIVYSSRLKVQRGRGIEVNQPPTSNKDDNFSFSNYGKSIPPESQTPRITGFNVIGDMNGECTSCSASKNNDLQGRDSSKKSASPQYQAGYDKEGRPVWIWEYKLLPVPSYVSSRSVEKMIKWQTRLFDQVESSLEESISEGKNVTGFAWILDAGGNYMSHLSSLSILAATKLLMDNMEDDEISGKLDYGFVINMTPVIEIMLSELGFQKHKSFKRFTLYGTDANKWKPALLEKIDKTELPPQYGGEADYVPVASYPIVSNSVL